MIKVIEKLLELCKFGGYSVLAIWLFSYLKVNQNTDGKEINEIVQNFINAVDGYILECTFIVTILEVITTLFNVFVKPFDTDTKTSIKQDLKINQLEYQIQQLENIIHSRREK